MKPALMTKYLFFFPAFLFSLGLFAQPGVYSVTDKKAVKYYEAGKKAYNQRNDKEAEKQLLKATSKAKDFVEAWTLLGYLYADQKKEVKCIDALKKAIEINPLYYRGGNLFTVARMELSIGRYQDALGHYKDYLAQSKKDSNMVNFSLRDIKSCEFAINAMKNPKPFKPVNMGPEINTVHYEYFPTVTADDQLFLFTRNIRPEKGSTITHSQEDFFFSRRVDGKWTPAESIGPNINTQLNEGAPCLSADGNLLFFVVCPDAFGYGEDRKGFGSCDIFYASKIGDKWSKAANVGAPVNSRNWESQPSFSSDGKTLYFIRGTVTQSGIRDDDIYMSELGSDGKWTAPKRLSDKINTPGREESVFIHPDNMTLYFSSNGHTGMGGMDIYMSKRQPDGEWGEPVNLGYPINTWADENSLLVGGNGEIAYFASDREGGFGGLDLYYFELDQSLRPEKISYFKGKVYDKETGKPLFAFFELIDLETGKVVVESNSNAGNGQFLLTLTANRNYALNVSRDGYLFFSENFAMKESPSEKPFLMDVPLVKPKEDEVVELKNVFFETAKFNLKPESRYELDKLVSHLQKNPGLQIELRGHTDNVGDPKSNQLLSENRAKSVYNYLIEKGISKDRLSWKGFGETMPKTTNDTPEGRAINRRTEYRILKK
jgi:outer membrane protein OmpA-like peptidoglycan-associated protein